MWRSGHVSRDPNHRKRPERGDGDGDGDSGGVSKVFPNRFQMGKFYAYNLDVGMIRESVSLNAPLNQRKPVPLTH